MLSPSLGRAFRSACTACPPVGLAATRPTARGVAAAAAQTFARPFHQRRPSSSKPAPPSGGGAGPAPPAPLNATAKSTVKKVANRSSKKRQPVPAVNLPRVPPTDHLRRADVDLSSFFSLHRPISITTAIPPTATEATFNEIFDSQAQEKQKYANVIFTLTETAEALDGISRTADAEDMYASDSLDALTARFRPFRPPPPPEPFQEKAQPKKASRKQKKAAPSMLSSEQGPQKSWSATIVVTESTNPNGTRTYTASSTPMVEIPIPSSEEMLEPDHVSYGEIQQPFLERMRVRQQRWMEYRHDRAVQRGNEMYLISVKRQRKLKMKKHKYKKLMRRTRNERRKLGKA